MKDVSFFLDPETEVDESPQARLRAKLGINEFSSVTPDGLPNEDYLEPFKGIRGIKQMLSIYLMKSVYAVSIFKLLTLVLFTPTECHLAIWEANYAWKRDLEKDRHVVSRIQVQLEEDGSSSTD